MLPRSLHIATVVISLATTLPLVTAEDHRSSVGVAPAFDTFEDATGYQPPLAANHIWCDDVDDGHLGIANGPAYPDLGDELSIFLGVDGSKQPQDFGVNANLGGQVSMNWGLPVVPEYGIGGQIGTGFTSTANAVRVYELLGETTNRTQSFTTVGLFQRTDSGWSWGFVHDFLYEDYFDRFDLSQWRTRGSYLVTAQDEIGLTAALRGHSDSGEFLGGLPVTLQPINQGHGYWRHFWSTGAQTTAWAGLADGHGEDNAVTGLAPDQDDVFVMGADVLMPLNASFAIYGETNMIMPPDTGTVDAFLGLQWYPRGNTFSARRSAFSPLLPLASPASFAVDLFR